MRISDWSSDVCSSDLLAVLHTLRIEHAAQDVIAHAGKVAHTAAADQHDAVLLEVVAFAGDIGDDFALVGQTELGDLSERRLRLFRWRRLHPGANTGLFTARLPPPARRVRLLRFPVLVAIRVF